MKRITKFKFWNFIVGRMSQIYTLQQLHDEEVNFNNLRELQFTGFKDMNRIEIYEGDIFQYYERNGVIKYSEFSPQFVLFSDNKEWPIDKFILRDLKVIGNIYENPELLKQ